ncbi:MAG: HlyD family efflux transporter periplasmic adaptor subunit [Acidobacteriia bacterium]|nr:HlyD family efflux transporter periplasmic adaptor subunit [Terriglobia bacterium]
MQFFSSRSTAPDGGGASAQFPIPVTGPTLVPPRKPEKRRGTMWYGLSIALILILGIAVFRYRKSESAVSAKGQGISVPVAVVSMGNVTATVRVAGTIAAMKSASLLAPRILGSRSGINRGGDANFGPPPGGGPGGADFNLVLLSLAKAGTRVKAGDVVAQFDPQNQLQRLDDYKDSAVQLENSIKSMTANLASIKEAHDQTVRTAKANWDKAILDLQTAPVHAQIDVEKLKLAVEEAEATYKQLVFEASLVEESQRAQIRISALNLDQSKIELQRAENNVRKMTIKAPMDGTIVMASIVRNGEFGQIREGDQVNAGQPFVTIVDPSSMILNATVNQVDAERLRLGSKGVIHVDAYPDVELPGTLTGIGAMSRTSTFRASYVGEIPVRIKIEHLDPHLIPELTGSAEIATSSENNTVVAPRTAVMEENGGSFVFVQDGDAWSKRPVELGLASFTTVAVHSGLRPSEAVAIQPAVLAQSMK